MTISTANSMETLHCSDGKKPSSEHRIAIYVILFICIAIHVAAIANAASGKGVSATYNADVLLSVMSPIMYWALKLFKVIGFPKMKA